VGLHLYAAEQAVTTPTVAPEEGNNDSPASNPICKLPVDLGTQCNGTGSNSGGNSTSNIRWHWDEGMFNCMAFGYKGCGGNANRFSSSGECWDVCTHRLQDYGGCSGKKAPAKNSEGGLVICYQPGRPNVECPQGYKCKYLAFFGQCCHTETEELYSRNWSPKCENGTTPLKIQSGGFPHTVLGTSCAHEFCPPATHTCHKQEILAYCCPRAIN